MKTSDMRESKFLKQSDVGQGLLLTIQGIEQHNVAKEGADPELRFCMTFAESEKPLVLNTTNVQICEKIFGSDETDDWTGRKIVLYTDPNVSFQGKIVGGIRVRAPKLKPVAAKPVQNVRAVAKPVQAVQPVRAVAKPSAELPVEIEPDFTGGDADDMSDVPF